MSVNDNQNSPTLILPVVNTLAHQVGKFRNEKTHDASLPTSTTDSKHNPQNQRKLFNFFSRKSTKKQ
ncbi:hypothetical protein P5673_012135, partial [Acropora cervicornis]